MPTQSQISWPGFVLAVFLAGCGKSSVGNDPNSCGRQACPETYACIDMRCVKACNSAADCEHPQTEACVVGRCTPATANECSRDSDCSLGTCDTRALCQSGSCLYDSDPVGSACDDGDPCTVDDQCDGLRACTGTPNACDQGPEPACSADNTSFLQYEQVGTCDPLSGRCEYAVVSEAECGGDCNANCLVKCETLVCTTTPGDCTVDPHCDPGEAPSDPATCVFTPAPDGATCDLAGSPAGAGDGLCSLGVCSECLDQSDCDDGNICTVDDCIGPTCVNIPVGANLIECRAAAGQCDFAERCDGSGTCPPDLTLSDTTVCRQAAGVCDAAESCTGTSIDCPPDDVLPIGTSCRSASGDCDVAEDCDGASISCPADAFVGDGTSCDRVAVDDGSCFLGACVECIDTVVCDDANPCTVNTCSLPAGACVATDQPALTPCPDSAPDDCDRAECDGTGTCVQVSSPVPAATECRPISGSCDAAESCDGSPGACPADLVQPDGTACMEGVDPGTCVAGSCDTGCVGAGDCDDGNVCTIDTCSAGVCEHSAAGAGVCRAAAGVCDEEEVCNGTVCPEDGKLTTLCRGVAAACDADDSCDGVNDDCPADAKHESTYVCRPSTGECDPTETCDGTSDPCPNDAAAADGTPCNLGGAGPGTGYCLAAGCVECFQDSQCDDGNPCTDDLCTSNACASVDNASACDDGDACTSSDVCTTGTCGGVPYVCDDGNPCTDDGCDGIGGCSVIDNTVACDDGDLCTHTDICAAGVCGSTAYICSDANLCTDDTCDGAGGCDYANNTLICNDGDPCTISDVCAGGTCGGTIDPGCSVAWWDVAWLNRIKITFANNASGETFFDFPVAISLGSPDIDYAKTLDQGEDIRFVDDDDATPLDYEIETWDEAGVSTLWVRVPQIDASSGNDYIWMYYNNPAALDASNPSGVWDASFTSVWHMADDPSGAAPQIIDSSGNANHGTATGAMGSNDQVTGLVGGALEFDGTDDRIALAPGCLLTSAGTVSIWVYPVIPAAYDRVLYQGIAACGSNQAMIYWHSERLMGITTTNNGNGNPQVATMPLPIATWTHIVWTFDGNTHTLYVDSVPTVGEPIGNPARITSDAFIASRSSRSFWSGRLDEVWYSNSARSADWARAHYLSTTGAFASYGLEESR